MEISLDKLISEISSNDDMVFFVGSAISTFEPTNIPNGNNLNLNIFKALTNKKEDKFDFLSKFNTIFEYNREKGLLHIPLERTLSYIWSSFNKSKKEKFFEHVNIFVKAPPNEIHETLTKMTSKKKDKIIITTNFDLALEKAFNGEKKIITKRNIKEINWKVPNNSIKIIKLHGSWNLSDTIVFTLEQEGKGLHFKFRDYLKKYLDNKIVCFIGYSASDFDIYHILYEINFEKVYWLIKPNSGENNRIERILEKKPGYYFKCFGNIEDFYNKITNKKLTILNENKEYKELIGFLSRELNLFQKYLFVARIFYILIKTDISIEILNFAIDHLHKEDSFKKHEDELIYWLASSYSQNGNLIKANRYYKIYLKLIEEFLNEDEKLFDAKLSLASSYIMMGNSDKARNIIEGIENIKKNKQMTSKKYIEKKKFICKELLVKLDYNDVINKLTLKNIKKYKKTLNNLEVQIQNLKIYNQRNGNLDSIVDCNMYLSRLKWIQGEYEEALKLLENVIETYEFSGNVMGMINAMRDKSRIMFSKGNIIEAIKIHEKILEISEIYGSDYLSIIKSCIYLAYYYALKHKYYNMVKYFFKATKKILYCFLTNKLPIKLFFIYFKNFKSAKNLLISR